MSEQPGFIKHRLLIEEIQSLIFEITEKGLAHGHYDFSGHCDSFTVSLSFAWLDWSKLGEYNTPWIFREHVTLGLKSAKAQLNHILGQLMDFRDTVEAGNFIASEWTPAPFERSHHVST